MRKYKNLSSLCSGFTLVEIMIVIAMIGVLAAALFPNMTGYLKRARDAARASDLNNIATGIAAYEIDKETLPPHVSGCYPSQALLSRGYTKKDFISPSGSGYDEGCGTGGRYAYGVSTGNVLDPQSSLLMAMMENWNGGNYTGSTLGMTGDLTLLGHFNATFSLSRGTGSIYILRPSAGSGGTAGSPPPAAINGSCGALYQMCAPGNLGTSNPGSCGGNRTWTCNGQFGGSSMNCTQANTPCPTYVFIAFDGNGGTVVPAPITATTAYPYNTAISALPSATRAGFSFDGWYTAPTGGTKITAVTSDATYYAQWNCDADGYDEPACTIFGQKYTSTSFTYPGCNTPDQVVCTCIGKAQTWSMCNVGSNTAGMTSASYGYMYQWGRNLPFQPTGGVTTIPGPLPLAAANATSSFITNSIVPQLEWLSSSDDNLWGGSGTTSSSGTYSSATSINQSLMKGPCATNYHVPTAKEACDMVNAINGTYVCGTANPYAGAFLKSPPAGLRGEDGLIYGQLGQTDPRSYFWLSSPSASVPGLSWVGNYRYDVLQFAGNIRRVWGVSVRCMKN